ncbi:MAG TPA: hypothetical protein PKY55_07185, partial [bacterium]|nr:hypothetical protein [bacterium]HPG83042.1 hypothetical protein [bacterium]
MCRKNCLLLLICSLAIMAGSCSKDETTAPGPLGREEAINRVVKEILPAAVPKGADYVCLAREEIVEKGAVIEEDTPENLRQI